MSSFKDSRPIGPSSNPRSGRNHSHSISLGAVNVNHRVTRRKSINAASSAAAAAAAAAVLNENKQLGTSPATSHRRGLSSRRGAESTSVGASSNFGSYMGRGGSERKNSPNGALDGTSTTTKPVSTKNRSRRASEGSHLVRGEGKRSTTELKCDRCGKGYKHSSCLTKHMWEHDPAWAFTSKLLISKHQQVQLLEAATVLVNMKPDTQESLASLEARGDSDRSSASPTVSGISELRDGLSSTETTPPPMGDDMAFSAKSGDARFGHHSSAFSRSFQSIPSSSLSSIPSYSPVQAHFRQSSLETRPSTAETGALDDDAAGLAAAVELCNFGTPRTIPGTASDVPPVPPLPPQYLGQSFNGTSVPTPNSARAPGIAAPHSFNAFGSASRNSSTPTMYNAIPMHAPPSYRISDERDVRMDDIKEVERDEDDFDRRDSAMQMDDDDDGVFGRMEE